MGFFSSFVKEVKRAGRKTNSRAQEFYDDFSAKFNADSHVSFNPHKKVKKEVKRVGRRINREYTRVEDAAEKEWSRATDSFTPDPPEMPNPAKPPASPEKPAISFKIGDGTRKRRRNQRNKLRIDMNSGGSSTGNGVNVPVG